MWTLIRLAATVIVSVIVAVAGLFVVRTCVPAAHLNANNEVAGNYLQPVGTIYAVLLAFVVFVVWTQFNEARKYVEHEANELMDLFRIARHFAERRGCPLIHHARLYAEAVIKREWVL